MKESEETTSDRVDNQRALELGGYESLEDVMEESLFGPRPGVPSMCEHACEVEPDGKCQHGHPSILRANGLI